MSELFTQIRVRAHAALASLSEAQETDDLHLANVRVGELCSLARTASEHDLDLPELEPYLPRMSA